MLPLTARKTAIIFLNRCLKIAEHLGFIINRPVKHRLRGGIAVLLVLMLVPLVALAAQGASSSKKVVVAVPTDSVINVDGDLTEPAWETAQPATDFVQQNPSDGQPATERTEVRILYDQDNLYLGVWCYDTNFAGPIIRDITRDLDPTVQDSFAVLLDTFNDDRNGFLLQTTPAGGKYDVQFFNEGRDINVNWDGVWRVQARVHREGWTAEFAIPFKTLRFSREQAQLWGINFERNIRRKNELAYWSAIPRRYGVYQISRAGELHGLEGITPGRNLKVKPFVLGGFEQFYGQNTDRKMEGGLDLKYGVTSELTMDLTANTDFSQVEVDDVQVNLTRFPLFFPEKREFFLENAGIFQLGETYRLGPPRNNEVIPFFSRRIGLTERGQPVPILGGARLTGHTGGFYLGLMNIQTRSEASVPANNFTVARVRRDVLTNSDVGVLFLNRQSRLTDDYNRLIGGDVNLQFFRDLKINGVLARTQSPHLKGDDGLQKIELNYRRDNLRFIGSYLDIQNNFNPEMGFVRRPGRRIIHNEFGTVHRFPRDSQLGSVIRDILPLVITDYAILSDGTTETKLLRFQLRIEFQDGGAFEGQYKQNFDRLREPFDIRRNGSILIPAGDYRFNESTLWYYSDKSKILSGDIRYSWGGFFSGTWNSTRLIGTFRPSYRFSSSVQYERSNIDLAEGSFTTDVVSFRLGYSFSPRMFVNALIQYNSEDDQILSNVRFRLIHRPLSDLFLVYRDQRDVGRDRTDRALILKYTQLFNF